MKRTIGALLTTAVLWWFGRRCRCKRAESTGDAVVEFGHRP